MWSNEIISFRDTQIWDETVSTPAHSARTALIDTSDVPNMSLPQSAKSENVVRTRILVLSDTHTQTPKPPDDPYHAYREPLPSADLLLHAGDITKVGRMTEYRTMVEMIKRHPAELKLVIAGNHDITLDPQYYDSQHGRSKHEGEDIEAVRDLWTGEDAKKHGLVYLEEGTAKFELKNGAKFTVRPNPQCCMHFNILT